MTHTPGNTPRSAPSCPLCGQPNGCAAVAAGSFDVACWCQNVAFGPDLLARVPPNQRGLACICRRCAEGSPNPAAAGMAPLA